MCHLPPERPLCFGKVLPICIPCQARPCVNVSLFGAPGALRASASSAAVGLAGVLPETAAQLAIRLPLHPRVRGDCFGTVT